MILSSMDTHFTVVVAKSCTHFVVVKQLCHLGRRVERRQVSDDVYIVGQKQPTSDLFSRSVAIHTSTRYRPAIAKGRHSEGIARVRVRVRDRVRDRVRVRVRVRDRVRVRVRHPMADFRYGRPSLWRTGIVHSRCEKDMKVVVALSSF